MITQSVSPRVVTFAGDRKGNRVTAGALISVLEKALVWLRGRDPNSIVDWEVLRVKMGDPVRITFRSEQANGDIAVRLRNLRQLGRKKMPKLAPHLTDEDIEGTQELAKMIGADFSSVRISSPGAPTVRVTPALAERVEEIAKVARGSYNEWGTVRGFMYQITVGRQMSFRIRHDLTEAGILCDFEQEKFEEVKSALPARVEVYGRIRRDRSDKPKSVAVERLRILPEDSKPFDEVPPVNITDGEDSADYVERIRGGS